MVVLAERALVHVPAIRLRGRPLLLAEDANDLTRAIDDGDIEMR